VTALMPRLDLAVLPALVMGAGAGLSFVTGYTLLQQHADDEVRGRTFAAFNTGVRAALFASLVVGPFLLGLIGLERSQAAIDAGREETSVEELDTDAYYPYQIGGIRLTLMLAGLVAIGGAVWSGHSIHQVLVRRERDADEIVLDPAPVRRVGRGVFLAFEGGEGAGKSTQIERLRQHLARQGYDIVVTREPGGTPLGERIRGLLLDPTSHVSDRAEALLFAAARAQHAEERIRPALARGAIVLCDRYIDSSVVYQGAARGLGLEQVERLSRWATGELLPDRVLLLDVPPELGMSRAGTRPDRLEQAGLSFHQMVNETYRSLAADHPERYSVIDATATPDAVQSQLRAIVEDLLDEQHAAIAEEHPS
jgi:dTMP kinase